MISKNAEYDEYKSPRSLQDDSEKNYATQNSEDGNEPNKYFEGDAYLSEVERLTEKKIFAGQEIDNHDIENLCSGNLLVNKLYCRMSAKKRRKKAIVTAANVILMSGRAIQNQINKNDQNATKAAEKSPDKKQGDNLEVQNNNQESSKTATKNNPQNAKSEIPKISGGTLSEIITKITEMLAGKSDASLKSGVDNFGAMIEVLAMPEVEKKLADAMIILAKDPILVADIKDVLKGVSAGQIFNEAIDKCLSKDEKLAVSLVSNEALNVRRAENMLKNVNQDSLSR